MKTFLSHITKTTFSLFLVSTTLMFDACKKKECKECEKCSATNSGGTQATLTLQPDAAAGVDASLGYHDNYGTDVNNYGTDAQFKVSCRPGYSGGRQSVRELIKFDLSSIPTAATVQSAKLYLYATGYINTSVQGHSGSNTALLERITSPWSESTVTWATAPTSSGIDEVAVPQSTVSDQDYVINVTQLVSRMVSSPSTNYGFYFHLVTEDPANGAWLFFYSSDHTDPTKRPKLVVTYTN